MAKYKVGDKVRIVSERPEAAAFVDSMVRFLGKEITISMVREESGAAYYYSEDVPAEDIFGLGRAFCSFLGVPGWCLREEWISGTVEPKNPEFSVSVRFHGRLTVAELVKDGKVVKVENARCNPKDKYSMAEGARIAVERLFGKQSGKPKIGDKFVIIGNSIELPHSFDIGTIVTLIYLQDNGCSQYQDNFCFRQFVSDRDVKPYKESVK